MKRYLFGLALAMAFHQAACGAGNSTTSGTSPEPARQIPSNQADTMKIRLRIKDAILTATLRRSKTAQDFATLLPITLTLNNLFRREKYGGFSLGTENSKNYRNDSRSKSSTS
jgi:hypothetical protein